VHVDGDQLVQVHRGHDGSSGIAGAGMPTVCGSRPTEVAQTAVMSSGVQPP
jgi:hypothetical protein